MDGSYECARVRATTWNQLLIHANARRVPWCPLTRVEISLLVVRIALYPEACQHHRLKQSCVREIWPGSWTLSETRRAAYN